MKKIFVIGSINKDHVISVDKFPELGETRNGYGFFTNQGGKGANQAIACKKLGCEDVYLIAAVGKDENGEGLIRQISDYNIRTDLLSKKENVSTGVCMIVLDDSQRNNVIIIDRGANDMVSADDFASYLMENASKGDILITQLEICLSAVYDALKLAKELGMYVILNPAPFVEFDYDYLQYVDLIVPNETEAKLFTGVAVNSMDDARQVYRWFRQRGVKETIITLGGNGSVYLKDEEAYHCAPFKTIVVDTTSAGDTFIGALACQLAQGKMIEESMRYANLAASITVSRKGAGVSIPLKEDVDKQV